MYDPTDNPPSNLTLELFSNSQPAMLLALRSPNFVPSRRGAPSEIGLSERFGVKKPYNHVPVIEQPSVVDIIGMSQGGSQLPRQTVPYVAISPNRKLY